MKVSKGLSMAMAMAMAEGNRSNRRKLFGLVHRLSWVCYWVFAFEWRIGIRIKYQDQNQLERERMQKSWFECIYMDLNVFEMKEWLATSLKVGSSFSGRNLNGFGLLGRFQYGFHITMLSYILQLHNDPLSVFIWWFWILSGSKLSKTVL